MKPTFAKLLSLVLLVGVFLISAGQSNASLIAYEGFDYATNTTVAGQTGGTGWTNAWAAGGTTVLATNVAGSLSYTDANGQMLLTTGGSLVVGNPAGTTTSSATPNRLMPGNLSRGSGTTAGLGATNWISFLYKRLNFALGTLPYLRQANFGLFQAASEQVDICGPNTTATISNVLSAWGTGAAVHNVNAPFQAANYPINSGSTYFILVRVVTDGTAATDTAHIWFNWTNLLSEPDISTAAIVENEINLSSVNTMRFQAGGQNASGSNAVFQVDELRIGTTFADVTPQAAAQATPPSITSQPADLSVVVGDAATFTVNADGTAPLRYQWYFNTNTPIANATNLSLTILNVQFTNAGTYSVVITNGAGVTNSALATLTVLPPVPPVITAQPKNFTNVVGFNAYFSVTATGTAPFSYQWFFNTNTLLPALTNATAQFAIASTGDAGSYSVIITNRAGAITSSVASLTVVPGWPAGLPVFPGADGGAKSASGGRGGMVYHVTKLDRNYSDTNSGTLRYGLTDGNFPPGVPRTIVFDVAGTFWLGRYGAERPEYDNGWDAQSAYSIPKNITLAGQSAPGPVVIMGGVTKSTGANVVLRNVTFAPGYGMRGFNEPDKVPPTVPTPGNFPDSSIYDALEINGQSVMLDHLTMLYGTAGMVWIRDQADNLTMQYCTIALGENYPQRVQSSPGQYQGLGYGCILEGGLNAKISFLNNLSANLAFPLWLYSSTGVASFKDIRNNVTYNWLSRSFSSPAGVQSYGNFINNFYLAGPGGDGVSSSNIISVSGATGIFSGSGTNQTHAYVSGNFKDINNNGSPYDILAADNDHLSTDFQPAAYDVNIGLTLSANAGFTNVLQHVGARWWVRPYDFALGNTNAISTNDVAAYLDQRLIKETATGTGRVMAWADDPFNSDPAEGWEWRALLAMRADSNTYSAPFNRPAGWDTDGDGMPDAWEISHGLDPNVPNNNGDFDNDGFTDLEEYLNEVAAWPAPGTIIFTGDENNRYARIFNWRVYGQPVNITNLGNSATFSFWQPSRYDTALVSNTTVIVDAVGQDAGILRLTNSAALNITNGWLKVATSFENSLGCTSVVSTAGSLIASNVVNRGTLRLTGAAGLAVSGTFTNTGTLDVMTWSGILPAGLVNTGVVLDKSLIKISSAAPSGTNFMVTIQGYMGHSYQLQSSDNLSAGLWQNLGASVAGSNVPVNFNHAGGADAGQRFYRVAVSP